MDPRTNFVLFIIVMIITAPNPANPLDLSRQELCFSGPLSSPILQANRRRSPLHKPPLYHNTPSKAGMVVPSDHSLILRGFGINIDSFQATNRHLVSRRPLYNFVQRHGPRTGKHRRRGKPNPNEPWEWKIKGVIFTRGPMQIGSEWGAQGVGG